MATIQSLYGSVTNLTVTLTSLASSATAGRESTVVDNSSTLYLDALVQGHVKLLTGTPANDKCVYVYAYGSVADVNTDLTDAATGTDAAFTHTDPPNLKLLGVINAPAAGGLTYKAGPWSVAAAFGGVLPPRWGIVVRNYTGLALSATSTDHVFTYRGVNGSSV